MSEVILRRRDPLDVIRYVLQKLEKQAIAAGSHPVLIHEGLEAEEKVRAEVERLRAKTVNISVIHPPIDERVRELNERVTDLYADVTEWHDTAERNKKRAEAAEAKLAEAEKRADDNYLRATNAEELAARQWAEVERLRDEVARLANLNIHIGDDAAKDRAEVERLKDTQRKFGVVQHELSKAVELALDLFENGLVDFKKYGLRQDSDIADLYRSALRGGGE